MLLGQPHTFHGARLRRVYQAATQSLTHILEEGYTETPSNAIDNWMNGYLALFLVLKNTFFYLLPGLYIYRGKTKLCIAQINQLEMPENV